jgi:hypothetical protein
VVVAEAVMLLHRALVVQVLREYQAVMEVHQIVQVQLV